MFDSLTPDAQNVLKKLEKLKVNKLNHTKLHYRTYTVRDKHVVRRGYQPRFRLSWNDLSRANRDSVSRAQYCDKCFSHVGTGQILPGYLSWPYSRI